MSLLKNILQSIKTKKLSGLYGKATAERGESYFLQGNVISTQYNPANNSASARIKGSRGVTYTAILRLQKNKNGEKVIGSCSCPMQFNCKHVVASLLKLASEHSSESKQNITMPSPSEQAVLKWLDSKVLGDKAEVAQPKIPHDMIYMLSQREDNSLIVTPYLARLLKKGGYGQLKAYRFHRHEHDTFLAATDRDILLTLNLLTQRETGYYAENILHLSGRKSSACLNEILKSGRAYWQDILTPLSLGDNKQLTHEWIINDKAEQELHFQIDNSLTKLIFLDETWYLNLNEQTIGKAISTIPSEQLNYLQELPPVPSTLMSTVEKHLKKQFPKQKIKKPKTPLKERIITAKKISPVLHLNLEEIKVDKFNYMYDQFSEDFIEELPTARLSFLYDEYQANYSVAPDPILSIVKNNEVIKIARDFNQEMLFLTALGEQFSLSAIDDKKGGNAIKYIIEDVDDPDEYADFFSATILNLESQGWTIIKEHPIFATVITEADVDWFSAIESSDNNQFFDLNIGIIINNKKVNILPLIVNAMKIFSADDLIKINDNETFHLALSNDTVLAVPFSRIKPMVKILVELYESKLTTDGKLSLHNTKAGLLAEIDKAYAAQKMRWHGGDQLRALAKKIADFKRINQAIVPKSFQATLRDYQQKGVDWLQFLREYQLGGILADDMGLGKTIQTLAHLSIEKNQGRLIKPSLIIAPTSLMSNWKQEAKKFAPNLKVLTFHGDDRKKHAHSLNDYDILLTTYALLARDKEILLSHDFYYLILDEAQFIKNHKAKSTQVTHQIKATHRLCLTGTPMENHLGEMWSLFHFLMPGFLGEYQQFNQLFKMPIEKNNDKERSQSLSSRIKPFLLRRKKNSVLEELPDKTEVIRTIELAGEERDLYESIRIAMEKKVQDAIQNKGMGRSHLVILDALLKLRQTCCHPKLLKLEGAEKAHHIGSKLALLESMLPDMVEEGRKIIVFSQFTSMLSLIEERLNALDLKYVKLTGATKNREKPITAFQDGSIPIFLISLKAGGTGLNLTAADTVIHYDPWWNPAVEDQATDRAHRMGQKNPVFVYKLIASGTVEEKIQQMQQKKRQLVEELLSNNNQGALKLTATDLAGLFEPL